MHTSLGKIGDNELLVSKLIYGILALLFTWAFIIIIRKAILKKPRFIIDKIDVKRRNSVFLITKYVSWTIGILISLSLMGFNVRLILFGSTALLVGLGFGLQNIFRDFVSGLFLLFEGSLKIGDVIEADGVVGKIVEINLRSTEVITRDDVTIFIPNSKFVSEKVVNWSHNEEEVRFKVPVNIAYGSDVDDVYECLESAMQENTGILNVPKPFVRFTEFADSSIEFEMIFWSKETFVIENLKSDLRKTVYKKLAEKGLAIPFPQRDIHIKDAPKSVEFLKSSVKEEQ